MAGIPKDGLKDGKLLQAWLNGLPEEKRLPFARVIAHRAAMRALPFIASYISEDKSKKGNVPDLTLTLFRVNAISRAGVLYPAREIDAAADAARAAARAASFAAADAASAAMWKAVTTDARALVASGADAVLASPLWPDGAPDFWQGFDRDFRRVLTEQKIWSVWLDWWQARVDGTASWGLPPALEQEVETRIALGDGRKDFWDREPEAVNAEIADWVEVAKAAARRPSQPQPPEPEAGPGPQYALKDGKLSETASEPGANELAAQAALHARLQRQAAELAAACLPLGNRYPALAGAAAEYSTLVSAAIADLDVTGVWSVGGALAGFAQAFREQNSARTLTDPLEPHVDALLQSVIRQHGAFILGFTQGRDLVGRADAFALDAARLAEITVPGNILLGELTDNRNLVNDETRALHQPVRDVVHEYGWSAGRNGYAAYLINRNAIRAIIKLTVGKEPTIAGIGGALALAAAYAGVPLPEFAPVAFAFLRDNSQALLTFFAHSPEMRAYIEWALGVLGVDKDSRD